MAEHPFQIIACVAWTSLVVALAPVTAAAEINSQPPGGLETKIVGFQDNPRFQGWEAGHLSESVRNPEGKTITLSLDFKINKEGRLEIASIVTSNWSLRFDGALPGQPFISRISVVVGGWTDSGTVRKLGVFLPYRNKIQECMERELTISNGHIIAADDRPSDPGRCSL